MARLLRLLSLRPNNLEGETPRRQQLEMWRRDPIKRVFSNKPYRRDINHRTPGLRPVVLSKSYSYHSALHRLMPNILRIQHPRLVQVARPLDDRSAVGKHRELVPRRAELQK